MRYIILPQALRAVIPALVGQCISLFKDTSLATIIGSLELLGIAKSVIEQAQWKSLTGGVVFEVFSFTAVVYVVFTYSMSRLSRSSRTRPRRGHALVQRGGNPYELLLPQASTMGRITRQTGGKCSGAWIICSPRQTGGVISRTQY